MFKRFLKREKGVTLVELLAVLVIIGVLAAIAVPTITGIINRAKKGASISSAENALQAVQLAVESNGGNPAGVAWLTQGLPAGATSGYDYNNTVTTVDFSSSDYYVDANSSLASSTANYVISAPVKDFKGNTPANLYIIVHENTGGSYGYYIDMGTLAAGSNSINPAGYVSLNLLVNNQLKY